MVTKAKVNASYVQVKTALGCYLSLAVVAVSKIALDLRALKAPDNDMPPSCGGDVTGMFGIEQPP
jgi:hypothetical protein